MQEQSLEELSQKINVLEKHHHIEILRMIKKNQQNMVISENSNGCFINMNELNEDLIQKIINYVNYNENQEKELNQHESIKNTIIQEMI